MSACAPAFARHPASDYWADGGADAAGCEQHADAGGRAVSDRKDLFAKNGKQSQDAAAQSPGRFDEQKRQHSRTMLYVLASLPQCP